MPSVLIVDDDPEVRTLLTALLSRYGFLADAVCNGEEALDALRKRSWDAVVLDLLMPRLNGFEVLQGIKAMDPETLRRVIVLTGAGDQTLRYFDSSSIHSLLRKPINRTELLENLRDCTRKAERSRAAGSRDTIGRAGARI